MRAEIHSVSPTATAKEDAPIESTPTTTVGKENPDRTVSRDRSVIADLRRSDIYRPTEKYYNARAPTNAEIIRTIAQVRTQFPTLPVILTSRDISSAFRLLKVHHALSLVAVTELPCRFFGAKHDVVLFYRPIPVGRNGSPAFFASFGDAIARIQGAGGTGRSSWNSRYSFTTCLYVGDGIFAELANLQRQEETVKLWGALPCYF